MGSNSLEIYLLNVSFLYFPEPPALLLARVPVRPLCYLILFAVNIALGCLLHAAVERLRRALSRPARPGGINSSHTFFFQSSETFFDSFSV